MKVVPVTMQRLLFCIFVLFLPSCFNQNKDRVLVFCAASTVPVMEVLAHEFEKQTGQAVTISGAASSTLARQIEQGAQADLFLSANPQWMTYLQNKNLLQQQVSLLRNQLVLISHEPGDHLPFQPASKAPAGRLALGDSSHVPAGIYARQALEHLGWWQHVQSQVIPTRDVRSALRLVTLEEVQWGIVYLSDLHRAENVFERGTFASDTHDPIIYPLGLLSAKPDAIAFFQFLQSDAAQAHFRDHGFQTF